MKTTASCRALCVTLIIYSIGCGERNLPAPKATPAVFNAAHAPTVEFTLPDMMCEDGCSLAVEEILERQPGAKDVRVDFEAKTATVAIDEGEFDAQAALAELVDKGFDHSQLIDDAGATDAKPQAAN